MSFLSLEFVARHPAVLTPIPVGEPCCVRQQDWSYPLCLPLSGRADSGRLESDIGREHYWRRVEGPYRAARYRGWQALCTRNDREPQEVEDAPRELAPNGHPTLESKPPFAYLFVSEADPDRNCLPCLTAEPDVIDVFGIDYPPGTTVHRGGNPI